MLFNTYEFLFLFLPITVGLYYLLRQIKGLAAAQGLLLVASLYFYAYSKVNLLLLVAGSIAINYPLSLLLARHRSSVLLTLGIALNLMILGYFKYAAFAVANVNLIAGTHYLIPAVALPLGISFLTFHQISYLVDVYKRKTVPARLDLYALYIVFFPHLIAGPIVRHAELMPQLQTTRREAISRDVAVGLTIFILGLAKKVLLADQFALYATPMFTQAELGEGLSMGTAWVGVFAYYFQIYFDFSGYSDMAIGLARMFGYKLPVNFSAPYRAANITAFWHRWHITLSRFLRDYLYIPLGGNRHGAARRYLNLFVVMLLGGFWHGAGWNFVVWGALHGAYLMVHHAWRAGCQRLRPHAKETHSGRLAGWFLTTLAVAFAWIFFRADSFAGAMYIMSSLFSGASSAALPQPLALVYLALAFFIVLVLPTPVQLLALYRPALSAPLMTGRNWLRAFLWRPSARWAAVMALLLMAVVCQIGKPSEFIYFRF